MSEERNTMQDATRDGAVDATPAGGDPARSPELIPTAAAGHRRGKAGLVVLNVILMTAVVVALLGRAGLPGEQNKVRADRTGVPAAADTPTASDGDGAGSSVSFTQPSPMVDMVFVLGDVVSAARLAEGPAARLYAYTLDAGRKAYRVGDRAAAVDAMVIVAGKLTNNAEVSRELQAFRQRQNPGPTDPSGTAVKVADEVLDTAATDGFRDRAGGGAGRGGLGLSGTEQPTLRSKSDDDVCVDVVETNTPVPASLVPPLDAVQLVAPEGTPRLGGLWLQITAGMLRGASDDLVADQLADLSAEWFNTVQTLARGDDQPVSVPAAAAWTWYRVIGVNVMGPVTMAVWPDLLLESVSPLKAPDALSLTHWLATAGTRVGIEDLGAVTAGAQLGRCGQTKGSEAVR